MVTAALAHVYHMTPHITCILTSHESSYHMTHTRLLKNTSLKHHSIITLIYAVRNHHAAILLRLLPLLLAERHRPDIVLADLVMPLMGGEELADRLRVSFGEIPVLYLRGAESETLPPGVAKASARRSDSSGQGERASGASAYLDKPFGEAELMESLRLLLGAQAPG